MSKEILQFQIRDNQIDGGDETVSSPPEDVRFRVMCRTCEYDVKSYQRQQQAEKMELWQEEHRNIQNDTTVIAEDETDEYEFNNMLHELEKVFDLLKSGEYALLKHSGDSREPIPEMSEEGRREYERHLANGDTEDVAFYHVATKFRMSGFCGIRSENGPLLGYIKRPFERWVAVKRHIKPIHYDDFEEIFEFRFEKERCLNDLTLELLGKKEFISKEDVLQLKGEVDAVQVEFVWNASETNYDELPSYLFGRAY